MTWMLAGILRSIGFSLIWLALSEADPANFSYGIGAVFVVTVVSLILLPPNRPRISTWPSRTWGTIVLIGWFLHQSVRGGVDVARRAITRPVDIAPAVVEVDVDLPPGAGQQLCLLLMNLLPGSMVQHVKEVDGRAVAEIHTLSLELGPKDQWRRLQQRVGRAVASN